MNEQEFRSFYEETNKKLWGYCFKIANDSSVADDVLQESYIRFLQAKVDHLVGPRKKAYLFRIATNLLNDHFRKLKRERKWFEKNPANEPQTHSSDSALSGHEIGEAFQQLSEQQRSLLWLAYVEEYEHKEIAEMLQIKASSVKVLLFRAKQKFHIILEKIGIRNEVLS